MTASGSTDSCTGVMFAFYPMTPGTKSNIQALREINKSFGIKGALAEIQNIYDKVISAIGDEFSSPTEPAKAVSKALPRVSTFRNFSSLLLMRSRGLCQQRSPIDFDDIRYGGAVWVWSSASH